MKTKARAEFKFFFLSFQGDSMMYHNTANNNGNCSGPVNGSPNSTPPNINACSSTTPPLSSGQTNHSDGNGNEMVTKEWKSIVS